MANYFDDAETAIAAVLTAYAGLTTALADDQPALEQVRYAIFTDLLGVASGIKVKDFCAEIRKLGGTSLAAVQADQDEGVGDYEA